MENKRHNKCPEDLTDKEQHTAVGNGEMAACLCGHLTWEEDLDDGACPHCGEYPSLAPKPGEPQPPLTPMHLPPNTVETAATEFTKDLGEVAEANTGGAPDDIAPPRSTTFLGDTAVRLRARLDITMDNMADLIGVHRNTIYRLETGAHRPRRYTLAKYAELAAKHGHHDLARDLKF